MEHNLPVTIYLYIHESVVIPMHVQVIPECTLSDLKKYIRSHSNYEPNHMAAYLDTVPMLQNQVKWNLDKNIVTFVMRPYVAFA